jgi:hypothetical protein
LYVLCTQPNGSGGMPLPIIGTGERGLCQTGNVLLVKFSSRMPSCVRSGELAVSVTGRAAGEGEGRPGVRID